MNWVVPFFQIRTRPSVFRVGRRARIVDYYEEAAINQLPELVMTVIQRMDHSPLQTPMIFS